MQEIAITPVQVVAQARVQELVEEGAVTTAFQVVKILQFLKLIV